MRGWRLISDVDGAASWNMAVDQSIFDSVSMGMESPTIRLYRWARPAISIGRFQNASRGIELEACSELGVEIVRRPTGGRGVLHGGDQAISVSVPLGSRPGSILDSYRLLASGFTHALDLLGIGTTPGEADRRSFDTGDCFAVRSKADVLSHSGAKLIGSAQFRSHGVILQQSSLKHRQPEISPERVFRGPVDRGIYPLVHCSDEELVSALSDGFRAALGITLEEGELSDWERERALYLNSNAGSAVVRELLTAEPACDILPVSR